MPNILRGGISFIATKQQEVKPRTHALFDIKRLAMVDKTSTWCGSDVSVVEGHRAPIIYILSMHN